MANAAIGARAPKLTEFLVPGIRVIQLPISLSAGPEIGTPLGVVEQDILRIEVTRVSSGSSQYCITLNNWFDSLPVDRKDNESFSNTRTIFASESTSRNGRPLQPRYKYNDFDLLRFGSRLRIEMGYRHGQDAQVIWVPMIAGPITDMKFVFADKGAQLTVSGEDDLSALKDKQDKRIEFSKQSERRIVESVLNNAKFPLNSIAVPIVAPEKFFADENEGISESMQKGQTYLDFLQKLAEPLDFEIFLEFNDIEDPNSGQSFHFEPCRARRPSKSFVGVHTLEHGVNLLTFTPTIKVADQFSSVEITGKHRDRRRPEQVRERALAGVSKDELHIDPEKDARLFSGSEIRQSFFQGRQANPHSEPASNIDKARGAWRAQSLMRKRAREFMTIEGMTIGLPKLRPGYHVEIRGMRAPFDGFYYLTKTVHSFGADGFRTQFFAHRPGMPMPPFEKS